MSTPTSLDECDHMIDMLFELFFEVHGRFAEDGEFDVWIFSEAGQSALTAKGWIVRRIAHGGTEIISPADFAG